MIAPGLRLVAAMRAGARLAGRPGAGRVWHVYTGPVTASGRFVPAAGRPLCGARTRRLGLLEPTASLGLDLAGRRVCRRCTAVLPPSLGHSTRKRLLTRGDWVAAYDHLTLTDLEQAAAWTRTVAECHQVATVVSQTMGPKPLTPPARRTSEQTRLVDLHDFLNARRRHLAEVEKTTEEQAADQATRERDAEAYRRITDARRRAGREAYATDKARRGEYLMPHERDWLRTPA